MNKKRRIVIISVGVAVLVLVGVLALMGFFGNRGIVNVGRLADPDDLPAVSDGVELPGMPADYVLSQEQIDMKKALTKDGMLSLFSTMRPGVDYVDGEFIFFAEDEAEAILIAEAYDGELDQFSGGIGKAKIKKDSPFSLKDLLAVSADMGNNMPPIDVNFLYSTDTVGEVEK